MTGDTRALLTEAAKTLGIASELRLVAPHRYLAILERIVLSRTTLAKSAVNAPWWWDALQEPTVSQIPEDPLAVLPHLISHDQPVWLVVEARSSKQQGSFWLYESTIQPICAALKALPPLEYYIVSKKMDWLVCENHHGYLIASGEPIVSLLDQPFQQTSWH